MSPHYCNGDGLGSVVPSQDELAQKGPNCPCSPFFDERKVCVQGQNYGNVYFRYQEQMTSKPHMVYDPKPVAYKAVRVWLSDGSRMLGIWTGTKWWSTKGEIQPVKWELEERKKMKTDKLRKAIARDKRLI
jgi:hypothetical protein